MNAANQHFTEQSTGLPSNFLLLLLTLITIAFCLYHLISIAPSPSPSPSKKIKTTHSSKSNKTTKSTSDAQKISLSMAFQKLYIKMDDLIALTRILNSLTAENKVKDGYINDLENINEDYLQRLWELEDLLAAKEAPAVVG